MDAATNRITLLLDLQDTRGKGFTDLAFPIDTRSDINVYVFFENSTNRDFSPSNHSVIIL